MFDIWEWVLVLDCPVIDWSIVLYWTVGPVLLFDTEGTGGVWGFCYDPGSSLHKRNDLQGKDGSTSALRNLTNGLAWADAKDDIGRVRTSGSKG